MTETVNFTTPEDTNPILRSETISDEMIQYVTDKIVRYLHPDKVILFGSSVVNPKSARDLDMLVVMPTKEPYYERNATLRDLLWGSFFEFDPHVYTPEEFSHLQQVDDPFLMEVLAHSKTLYEKDAA